MSKHDCKNYETCSNYAPKQPKALEHVAGERCDAPVYEGCIQDMPDNCIFGFTGAYRIARTI